MNRIKRFASIVAQSDSFVKKINPEMVVPFVEVRGMSNGIFNPEYKRFKKIEFAFFHVFKNNDILIASIDSCFKANKINIGKLKDGFDFGLCSSSVIVLRLKDKAKQFIDVEFLYWVIRGPYIKQLLLSTMQGSTGLKYMRKDILLNYEIKNLPPLKEQIEIAQNLNKKIYAIEKSIESGQKKVVRLKEYYRALIYERAAKIGFEEAKMKKIIFPKNCDSRIERIFEGFLKEIPEHWEVVRLKDFFHIVCGNTPSVENKREEHWTNGEYSLITGTEVSKAKGLYINEAQLKLTKEGVGLNPLRIAPLDSLVVSCVGEKLGRVKMTGGKLTCARGVVNLIFKNQAKDILKGQINKDKYYYKHDYKYFLFYIKGLKEILRGSAKSCVTMVQLSSKDIGEYILLVPPLEEQIKIANFLEEKERCITKIIDVYIKISKLSREYAKSLIYEETKQFITNPA